MEAAIRGLGFRGERRLLFYGLTKKTQYLGTGTPSAGLEVCKADHVYGAPLWNLARAPCGVLLTFRE